MLSIGSSNTIKTIETATEKIKLKIRLCIAALFAEALSSAPMNLDISEFPPAPIPFPKPTIIMNSGVMYPSAANGSAPSPATQILSMMLFIKIKNMLPIIGNDSVSGPASKFMNALGIEVSSVGVAEFYEDFLDAFVIDIKDEDKKIEVNQIINKVIVTNTIMNNLDAKKNLAEIIINSIP